MRSASISGWWYGQRAHAGAELDVLRALGRDPDEHLGRGDDLVAGRVVLADPRLVEAERSRCWISSRSRSSASVGFWPDRVERGHEDAEVHAPILDFHLRFSGLLVRHLHKGLFRSSGAIAAQPTSRYAVDSSTVAPAQPRLGNGGGRNGWLS